MTFSDPELQQLFQSYVGGAVEPDEELRPIFGLMALLDRFWLLEGEESPKVVKVMEVLCSEEMLPALRSWYRRADDDMNPAALRLREELSARIGERLGV